MEANGEEVPKSGSKDVSQAKSTASASVSTPKRKRVIDEDDDEEYAPTTVSAAPKTVVSAPAKSAASASAAKPKSEESKAPTSKSTGSVAKKATVKKEETVKEEEPANSASAPKASIKKSAAASASSTSSPAPNGVKATKAVKKEESESEPESDDDEDFEAPKKKKTGANGQAIAVKEDKASTKKAGASTTTAAAKKATAKKAGDKKEENGKAGKKTAVKATTASKAKATGKGKKAVKEEEDSDDGMPSATPSSSQADDKIDKFKWWEEEASKAMQKHPDWKWATLSHAGVIFAPPYVPHGVKMLYDGKPVTLSPEAEEAAGWFAKLIDGPHYEKPQFRKNFFAEFLALVRKTTPGSPIQKFNLCDFSPIGKYLKEQSEIKKSRPKEEKDAEKKAKAELKAKYGFAMVNGHKEPIGNFLVEPPGLFLGRGDHPKAGMMKRRLGPKDITLNLGKDAPVPPCPIPGEKWGGIVHTHTAGWIAAWTEDVTGQYKYVQFAAGSSIKGSVDRKKYEKARLLKSHIETIRKDYTLGLKSRDMAICQRATAMWVIDRLALRVGNEKKEDEADTVGCCSLRVEHVKLLPPRTLEFDFLGKDSMRYNKEVEVPQEIYDNFEKFQKGKRQSEDIFDQLNPTSLNNHLKTLMPGLSAKVFRTYNASITLQDQLLQFTKEFGGEPGEVDVKADAIRLFYNRANRQVAILCNHQKTVSKGHQQVLANLDTQIDTLKAHLKAYKKHLKELKDGKVNPKKRAREEDKDEEELKLPTNPESCKKKIEATQARIEKLEADKIDKGEGAQIQNSTSKINYMDPRITVAFCAKAGLDLKKVFTTTLLDKFAWAIAEVEEDPDFFW